MSFYDIINSIDGFLWGTPFLVFVLAVGLYFTVRGKMFTICHLGHVLKHTIGKSLHAQAQSEGKTHISPFEAACIAIGGTVGNGNIAGVATAVATGGPGAVFWIWLWAFFGMTLGGYRTSLSYPVLSSHADMPEEERRKIGITNGMMRISVGIENTQDLVDDFLQALEAAYRD